MLRVVPDINVLVSAFISKGNPHRIFRKCERKEIRLIVSDEILEEFGGVIRREKFGLDEGRIDRVVSIVRKSVEVIKSETTLNIIKDDPSDNKILECAVSGKADYIISGDKHLLALQEHRGIKILNSSDFLKIINQ